MKIRPLLPLLFVLILGPTQSWGQQGILLQQMPDRIWSQRFQPANLLNGEYSSFRYGGQGSVYAGNAQATLDGIFVADGFITEAAKDQIISQLGPDQVVNLGYHLGLAAVNIKAGNLPLGFYLDQRLDATVGFNDPNTFGLIFKGNGPYAGDTVSDAGISGRLYSTRRLGVGTAFEFGKLKFGVRLNLIQGLRMADLDRLNYSLYTHPDGIQIDLQANYSLSATADLGNVGIASFQGFGASLDLGVTYDINEKFRVEASVTDAGFTSWQTEKIEDNIDIDWQGVSITSLFDDSIPEILEAEVDSLRELVFPDTVQSNLTLSTPLSLRLGGTMQVGDHGELGAMIMFNPSRSGGFTQLPLINLRYQHEVVTGLRLAANAYGGGTDVYGVGVMAAYRLAINDWAVDLALGGENVIGYLAPSAGRGFSFFGGIGVQL
ncbi:MAG: DUF5723 family protein [Bacteroidota bacterium]